MAPPDGVKRGLGVWHRRAGKDSTAVNLAALKAHQRVGTYWHLLPTTVQARRVVWTETDAQGRRIIEQAFPLALRETSSEKDMSIRLLNGSLWQLGGSDNYNSLVGSNVLGVVFSEWALCDPAAWDYIRPILVENGGWALFIYTPRGRNHGWTLYETVRKQPARWYTSRLTVDDTRRENGEPVITREQVAEEIADGMSEERAAQEFDCSFAAGVEGAYFARQMEAAREDGRIGRAPWNPRHPVHLYFDLGIDDATACWFGQRIGWQRVWFKYLEWRDEALAGVFRELAAMPLRYGTINLPHDGAQRDKGTGRRIREYADDAWNEQPGDIIVHEAYDVQNSIEAARHLITQSWFDEEGCERGLSCLLNYAKVWDEKRRVYQMQPRHDWASHGADAWRLAGMDDVDEPIHEIADGRLDTGKPKVHSQVRGAISSSSKGARV